MVIEEWRRERKIARTLRALARQRVILLLQPGNVWVIERAVGDGERTAEALRTCHLRGWVEVLQDAVPHGVLSPDGDIPSPDQIRRADPIYRLTESGWSQIRRTHTWVVLTCVLAAITLIATIVGGIISMRAV